MQRIVRFEDLSTADLIVDALYEGGNTGNAGSDPLTKLLECGNQGGFRYRGTTSPFNLQYVILYSSLLDPDWPDQLDNQSGLFTYFGDNKEPGTELHGTRRKGNLILKQSFNNMHNKQCKNVPPFFIFTKGPVGRGVVFRGLAVPGANNLTSFDDLVAIWKIKGTQRFQNYKAIFTILDVNTVSRKWIEDLKRGRIVSDSIPEPYLTWLEKGVYRPLIAERSIEHRTKEEQMPDKNGLAIISTLYDYFEDGYAFEPCAAEILKLMDSNFISCDLTRPWLDGGRDAVAAHRIWRNGWSPKMA